MLYNTTRIQYLLKALGSPIEVDGIMGDATRRAMYIYSDKLDELLPLTFSEESKPHNLDNTSLKRLEGVHPDIVRVVKRASLYVDNLFVVDGLRQQKVHDKHLKTGASQTSRSYHLFGLAVDLVIMIDGKILWSFKKYKHHYKAIYRAISKAEKELNINVLDSAMFDLHWKTLIDYPHYQMKARFVPNNNPRKYYKNHRGKGF